MSGQIGPTENYVASRSHKRPCDLCGEPITVGQECSRWTWVDDVPVSIRVHKACSVEAKGYDWYSGEEWPDLYPLRTERAEALRGQP